MMEVQLRFSYFKPMKVETFTTDSINNSYLFKDKKKSTEL